MEKTIAPILLNILKLSPLSWEILEKRTDGYALRHVSGMIVIVSAATELDGEEWIHLSASYRNKIPTYQELCELKNLFIGPDAEAYQVFARESKHVNIHNYCLHLWSRVKGPALPDFTRGGNTI